MSMRELQILLFNDKMNVVFRAYDTKTKQNYQYALRSVFCFN